MKVQNEKIHVDNLEIDSIGSSSLVLVGDTDQITSVSVFDTPANSLIFNPRVPLYPLTDDNNERKASFCQDSILKEARSSPSNG